MHLVMDVHHAQSTETIKTLLEEVCHMKEVCHTDITDVPGSHPLVLFHGADLLLLLLLIRWLH